MRGRVNVGGGKYNVNDYILVENVGVDTINKTDNTKINSQGFGTVRPFKYSEFDDTLLLFYQISTTYTLSKYTVEGELIWQYDLSSYNPGVGYQLQFTGNGYIYLLTQSRMFCFNSSGELQYSLNGSYRFGATYGDDIFIIKGWNTGGDIVIYRYSNINNALISQFSLGTDTFGPGVGAINIIDDKIYAMFNNELRIYNFAYDLLDSKSLLNVRFTSGIVLMYGEIFKNGDYYIFIFQDANHKEVVTITDLDINVIAQQYLTARDPYYLAVVNVIHQDNIFSCCHNEKTIRKYNIPNLQLLWTYYDANLGNMACTKEGDVFVSNSPLYRLKTKYTILG